MYAIYNTASKVFLPPAQARGNAAWWSAQPGPTPRIFMKRMDAVLSMRNWLKGEPKYDASSPDCVRHQPRNPTNWKVVPVRVEVLDES